MDYLFISAEAAANATAAEDDDFQLLEVVPVLVDDIFLVRNGEEMAAFRLAFVR